MEASTNVERGDEGEARSGEIDWDAYASNYDLLAGINPSYRENIEVLRSLLGQFALPEQAAICDIGAGTGNYICSLARDLPRARFIHLDADPVMNEIAASKYSSQGIEHVDLHCCLAREAAYAGESFDLIICVNALYAMSPQRETLRKIRYWLKPSGTFFVIDYGRQVDVFDWTMYLLRSVIRERGMWAALKLFQKNLENLRQNRRGSQGQAEGVYWLHSTEEFGRILEDAGFEVEMLRPCYRGYSDLAVCRVR